MSGSIASRYIGGVPYGPGRSVGFYPNRASVGSTPGVTSVPGVSGSYGGGDAGGGVVAPQIQTAGGVQVPGGVGGDSSGGGDNMLAALLLGLLGSAPDLYRAGESLFGGDRATQAADELPTPPDQMPPPEIPGATPYGTSDQYGQLWGVPAAGQEGLHSLYDSQGRSLGSIDLMQGADDFGDLGAFDPGEGAGLAPTDGAGALANLGAAADDPLYGILGETPMVGGDLATGIAGVGGGALGGLISAQAPWTQRGYGAVGQQAGSALGGIAAGALMGSALGPIGTAFGALGGALVGGFGGGAAGSQMGPDPTIGRNFSAIGTFNGDGTIGWGNAGGDNGGDANGAMDFANWFGSDLMQEAAAQGLQFNPNMSGAQFRVGGYDNFNRTAQTPGGYFYTPDTGGSPENYALRPDSSWDSDPFSGAQANAFSQNVLADLAARGVFTQAGANQPGLDFYGQSQGTPLGWYGGGAGQGSYGSDGNPLAGGFGAILGDRQGAVQGYINAQQAQGAADYGAQQVLGNQFTGGGYDPNFGWQDLASRQAAGEDISAFLPAIYQQGGMGGGVVQADGGA